ncbi:hypothetical protein G4Y79_02605 [Phototrophicus methaneseepsis]|uniref:STAS domain-containing protein n=1 Tax=Phototrophicus methaneseepsis TaxID=2710758 RepID=A0A7S8EAB9_9CHLR|nr:hypothetical protein [Phototrophicus methaneseepsis]QPC83286.1 hypothetical protein G4Y79_02605 [Phototrophicus methaneseepsis]
MPYQLTWQVDDKVLLLALRGTYTLEEAAEANRLILDKLKQSQSPLILLIDATKMNRPYNFSDLRSVQTYMDDHHLKHIYVAADDRLVKLAMMVIFNLSRAYLHVCRDVEQANVLLNKQLVNT